MKVVFLQIFPPVGPYCELTDSSKRQATQPAFGQLGSEPAGIAFECRTCAHTLLLSKGALPRRAVEGSRLYGSVIGVFIGTEEVGMGSCFQHRKCHLRLNRSA